MIRVKLINDKEFNTRNFYKANYIEETISSYILRTHENGKIVAVIPIKNVFMICFEED